MFRVLRNILFSALVILIIVIIVTVLLLLVANTRSNNTTSYTSNPIPTSSTTKYTTDWQTFTSVEHGFKIDFPIYPSTERIPETSSEGITYSGTQYIASTSNEQ